MYRKIVWCYITILTLLDISLHTKLTAQGKSHGVESLHESLAEGLSFQEWGGSEAGGTDGSGGGAGGGGGGGRAAAAGALRLEPAALALGARPLGQAHAAAVTLINTSNHTLHLASVAGTTPDFHASFFDTKTLPPECNTTFSVVYLGRREGPAAAHLFIHTSLGVHKYPVSAEGVASEWGVWPLLGLRVPHNATLTPAITLRNPTDHPVQVSEVFSSGSWVQLSLAEGASRAAWLVPPHSTRDIVRLSISPPQDTATAYVRIKANATGAGLLVVGVQARAAPRGEHARPVHVRLRARGSRDPPGTWVISVGSSAEEGARLEAAVAHAHCAPLSRAHAHTHAHTHNHALNGVKAEGALVKVLKPHVDARQEPVDAVELTLDYEKMWAGYVGGEGGGGGAEGGPALCSGLLRLNSATVPYSLQLLPGTLRAQPPQLDFVTANNEKALKEVELTVINEFSVPIELQHLEVPAEVSEYVSVWGFSRRTLAAGAREGAARLRLRGDAAGGGGGGGGLRSWLTLRTNASDYRVPVAVYSGLLDLEWEWPDSADGSLWLGALSVPSSVGVLAALRNRAPRPLCVRALRVHLPTAAAQIALDPPSNTPIDQMCVPANGSVGVMLVVRVWRLGQQAGSVTLATPHGARRYPLALTGYPGRLAAQPLPIASAAPYAWGEEQIHLDNSLPLTMHVTGADLPPNMPGLQFIKPPTGHELGPGLSYAGTISYRPEVVCQPHCYTGMPLDTEEGQSWVSRAAAWAPGAAEGAREGAREGALRADRALLAERRGRFASRSTNFTILLHTTQVVSLPVSGCARLAWPRLCAGARWAGLAAAGGPAPFSLRLRNPSRSHPLAAHVVLGPPPDPHQPRPDVWAPELAECAGGRCQYAADSFTLLQWTAPEGGVAPLEGAGGAGVGEGQGALPVLVLQPRAALEVWLAYRPPAAGTHAVYLYIRNNLTMLEGVQLAGRSALPTLELDGLPANSSTPLLFEVRECGAGGVVRRVVLARNTGGVALQLGGWSVAGSPCAARGFSVQPCQPLGLLPNHTARLELIYSPDYTLARARAGLEAQLAGARAVWRLEGVAAPRLLRRCGRAGGGAAGGLRLTAAGLAAALLALVLAAGALDAERLLRRARAARAASTARAPLDLRALARARPAPPPPAPRAPPRRRRRSKPDPARESRAFDRWRAELRAPDDTDSRSSEEPEPDDPAAVPPRRVCHEQDIEPLLEERSESPEYPLEPEEEEEADLADERPDSEDEPASSSSDTSSPAEPDDESPPPAARRPAPRPPPSPSPEPRPPSPPPAPRRRSPSPRRADPARPRPAAKHHTRKDKPSKRRAPPPPTRSSPPLEPRAAPAVRWGASWSSVVARSAPPPPAPPPPSPPAPRVSPADQSLFYYNSEPVRPDPEYVWPSPPASAAPAPPAAPTPPVPTTATSDLPFSTPSEDFLGGESVAYGNIGPVWGSSLEARAPGAAWPWPPAPPTVSAQTGTAVRPPPGFGSTPTNPVGTNRAVGSGLGPGVARGARPYDPFQSLAAIWSQTALDWRSDPDNNN